MKRVELHAKTKYSMDHESTINIKDLILKCIENSEKGVALVDTDSVVALPKAEKILSELNIKDFKLVYGVEINVNYLNTMYKVVVILKNRNGVSKLYRILSPYCTTKYLFFDTLIQNKKDFVIGLLYNESNYNDSILQYFDYVEVDKNTRKDIIEDLKKKIIVVYSNRINGLLNEEKLSKEILYNKLNIKEKVENRIYQNTEEVLREINDREIVIDSPNKIFDMIEKFELIDDKLFLPDNNDFDIELLVYIELDKKFGNKIPKKIIKRVKEELKLIHEYNYDGYINLYKKIIDKCKEQNEEYIICNYINYLYIAYLLGIIHFDPVQLDLNYDIFFSHQPSISIKLSESFNQRILKYINNDLCINTIRCKGIMRLNGISLEKSFDDYENKNNIKLSLNDKVKLSKYLDDYPINNHAITSKKLILPTNFNLFELSPRSLLHDGNSYQRFINIDYKDIEHKFVTLELIQNRKITELNKLKNITADRIIKCNYKDNNIITKAEFKSYLKIYDDTLILDDLYENLINSDIELPDVFSIINEIRRNKVISKRIKDILVKNNINLKRYHNINFISRGILNERVRLEYELLYFKEYYPLEYYYVMLEDNFLNSLIEVVKKGPNEVLNNIKKYSQYRNEYNCLNLINEIYKTKINFKVEERILVEDFIFELDKTNNQIILVVNKVKSRINNYLFNNISLIGTRPVNGKMPYMSKVIYELLNENKNVTLFALNGPINYYLEYLLNEITKIERKYIHQYLNPCSCYKDKNVEVNEEYINGLNFLLNKNLAIKDYHLINDTIIKKANTLLDKLLYMIHETESKLIIIDRVEVVGDDLERLLENMRKIAKEKDIHFIIFTNLKREYEKTHKKDITLFENSKILDKYINYISILDGDNLQVIKEK